jgi:hypothetical protein
LRNIIRRSFSEGGFLNSKLRQPLKIQETRPVIASEAKQSTLLNEKQRLLRRFTPRNDGARLFLEVALNHWLSGAGKKIRNSGMSI